MPQTPDQACQQQDGFAGLGVQGICACNHCHIITMTIARRFRGVAHQSCDIDGFGLQRLASRSCQHRLQQASHLDNTAFHPGKPFALCRRGVDIVLQHFHCALDDRQGCTQLMAGIRQERLFVRVGIDQAGLIAINGSRQTTQGIVADLVGKMGRAGLHG